MSALIQCPFCGAWPKLKIVSGLFVTACTKCQSMSAVYDNADSAIKAWNKRFDIKCAENKTLAQNENGA